jgi:hypothetical protein
MKSILQNALFSLVIIGTLSNHDVETAPSKLITQLKQTCPELSGLIDFGISFRKTKDNIFHQPTYNEHVVEIHQTTKLSSVESKINLSSAMQFAALTKGETAIPEEKLLAYEIISKLFALNNFSSLKQQDQEEYMATLEKSNSSDYELVIDYTKLLDQNANSNLIANRIGQAILAKYPEQADIESKIKKATDLVLQAMPLATPTHMLMTQGGDDRLIINPQTQENKYCTSNVPFINGISRSSCTSSRPTTECFASAERLRIKLIKDAIHGRLWKSFCRSMKNTRNQISMAFLQTGLDSKVSVCTTPSGSDAELIFSTMALLRHSQWEPNNTFEKPLVLNIVVTAGEVGSGTPNACDGQHFSSYIPSGERNVKAGECIDGLAEGTIKVLEIPAREKDTGTAIATKELENLLEETINTAVNQNGQVVIMHIVHASKTGIGTPSTEFAKQMLGKHGQNLIVVVDAAQTRCDDPALRQFIEYGFNVILTGSKFFAGPPFSGAVLIPESQAEQLKNRNNNNLIPAGMSDYLTQNDVDEKLVAMRQTLPNTKNIGLLLRWQAALHEIKKFYAIDTEQRKDIATQWVNTIKNNIRQAKLLKIFEEPKQTTIADVDTVFASTNTIISFTLHPALDEQCNPGLALNTDQLKKVYVWLTQDISAMLPATASKSEKKAVIQKCIIGQPVKISQDKAVLRIALSAPMVSMIGHDKSTANVSMQKIMKQDKKVIAKLETIAKYYRHLIN